MKQLTIRSNNDQLHQALKQKAAQQGISVNRLIIQLLSDAVGLSKDQSFSPIFHDLDHLAGTWTADFASEFSAHIDAQRTIDEALWQ